MNCNHLVCGMLLFVGLTVGGLPNSAKAALTAEQRRQIEALDASVTQAARLFLEGKYSESCTIIRQVQADSGKLAASGAPEVLAALDAVYTRLSKAHALLELEGFSLPPLQKPGAAEPTESSGGISFAVDLAPVFSEHCGNCHGRAQRPSGGFDLMTFNDLLQGGDSGEPVIAGKPTDSLLLQRLQGTPDGDRMPLRAAPLPDEVIAKVEAWIQEGAEFDGPDPEQDLEQVARLAKARRASHQELREERKQLALKNWDLGMTGQEAEQAESENFFAIGNVGQATLQELVESADTIVPKLDGLFGPRAGGPLVKGRITLVALAGRYDYTEYGKMVERRDLPQSQRGHWRYNIMDAYVVIVPPRADEYSLDAMLAQQIAGAYVASLGEVPEWFAEGVARWAASRVSAEDSRVLAWKKAIPEVVGSMSQPADFLTGKLAPESANVAAFSYVQLLTSDAGRFHKLLKAITDGEEFEAAFKLAYGGTPSDVAGIWIQRIRRLR